VVGLGSRRYFFLGKFVSAIPIDLELERLNKDFVYVHAFFLGVFHHFSANFYISICVNAPWLLSEVKVSNDIQRRLVALINRAYAAFLFYGLLRNNCHFSFGLLARL